MRHADASVCPSCRGRIEWATTCPHCGLDLTSHEVQQAWQALVVAGQPFVAGAVVLAALTLANLGPVALAVPRWTLLAVAGVVLGGAGITWEDRVRDDCAAIRYVGSMR
jgi:hypothetical protein